MVVERREQAREASSADVQGEHRFIKPERAARQKRPDPQGDTQGSRQSDGPAPEPRLARGLSFIAMSPP